MIQILINGYTYMTNISGLNFHVNIRIQFVSWFAQVLNIRIYMDSHEIFQKFYERE